MINSGIVTATGGGANGPSGGGAGIGGGGNGEDGEPGSLFLICISDLLIQQFGLESVTALVDGGKGGKGGAGGKGGIHGRGSSCYKEMPDGTKARAADGRPGKDGRDGARGDFLYVVADVVGFYLKAIGQ